MFIRLIVAMHCDNVTVTRIWPILIRSNRGISDKSALGDEGFEGAACLGACSTDRFPDAIRKGDILTRSLRRKDVRSNQLARRAHAQKLPESNRRRRRRGCRDGRRDADAVGVGGRLRIRSKRERAGTDLPRSMPSQLFRVLPLERACERRKSGQNLACSVQREMLRSHLPARTFACA